jgi:hypothetical protein
MIDRQEFFESIMMDVEGDNRKAAREKFNTLTTDERERFFDFCEDYLYYDAIDAEFPDYMQNDIRPYFLND